jgi:methyl-accepting chemotaxis protein
MADSTSIPFRSRLSVRLLAFGIGCSLACVAALSIASTIASRNALLDRGTEALAGIADARAERVTDAFRTIRSQVMTFSDDPVIVEALAVFAPAFAALPDELPQAASAARQSVAGYYRSEFIPRLTENAGSAGTADSYIPAGDAARIAQHMYIASNPNAVGEKLRLDRAPQETTYNAVHAQVHPRIREYLEAFEYYDIFLIDTAGNIVYSVYKETDYATNLVSGPYKDSGLAEAFRGAARLAPREATLVDYRPYTPSYGAPAAFIAAPVFENGERLGVVAFQAPVSRINAVLTSSSGLGETGYAYLVGGDGLLRTDTDQFEENTILSMQAPEAVAEAAKSRERSLARKPGLHGEATAQATVPLDIEGVDWSLCAMMPEAELLAPAVALQAKIFTIGGVVSLIAAGAAVVFARSITRPLMRIMAHFDKLARRDFSARIGMKRNDEIGKLANTTDAMTGAIAEVLNAVNSAAIEVSGAATEIAASSEELAQGMENQLSQTSQSAAAVEELSASAGTITDRADSAAEQARNLPHRRDPGRPGRRPDRRRDHRHRQRGPRLRQRHPSPGRLRRADRRRHRRHQRHRRTDQPPRPQRRHRGRTRRRARPRLRRRRRRSPKARRAHHPGHRRGRPIHHTHPGRHPHRRRPHRGLRRPRRQGRRTRQSGRRLAQPDRQRRRTPRRARPLHLRRLPRAGLRLERHRPKRRDHLGRLQRIHPGRQAGRRSRQQPLAGSRTPPRPHQQLQGHRLTSERPVGPRPKGPSPAFAPISPANPIQDPASHPARPSSRTPPSPAGPSKPPTRRSSP